MKALQTQNVGRLVRFSTSGRDRYEDQLLAKTGGNTNVSTIIIYFKMPEMAIFENEETSKG